MARSIIHALFLILLIASCKENEQEKKVATPVTTNPVDLPEKPSFFPVTDYLLGQIKLMKEGYVNPLLRTKSGSTQDSCWLKMDSIDSVLKDFTEPFIDSVSYSPYFKENKFEDATLQFITLSYDAQTTIPNNIPWIRWDIYIDPSSGQVRRVFLIRTDKDGGTKQLLFKAGDCWKITAISGGENGKIVSEKLLSLKYDSR